MSNMGSASKHLAGGENTILKSWEYFYMNDAVTKITLLFVFFLALLSFQNFFGHIVCILDTEHKTAKGNILTHITHAKAWCTTEVTVKQNKFMILRTKICNYFTQVEHCKNYAGILIHF